MQGVGLKGAGAAAFIDHAIDEPSSEAGLNRQ
jgi:hypothetical protein